MSEKIAIFIDGAFFTKKLKEKLGKPPEYKDVINHCNSLLSSEKLKEYKLFRIYYYDSPPLTYSIKNPLDGRILDLSAKEEIRQNKKIIESLELQSDFAVRKGVLACYGWKIGSKASKALLEQKKKSIEAKDLVPDIEQKRVDLKIGLDIAWLSLKHIADVILLITGDSDMIPAMKFARKEGIRIYLHTLNHPVRRELKVHTDLLIEI